MDIVGEFSDFTSRGYLTEDIFNKKNNVVRILGLGDSFSVNLRDKKQNYNNILQQEFIGSGRGDVEIVNAGMEAMGPGYYWHILNKLEIHSSLTWCWWVFLWVMILRKPSFTFI